MGDVAAIGIVRRRDLGPGPLWRTPVHARRCLFGSPDPDCTRTLLENETKILELKSRERWNFDFAEGRPLSGGRYAWTPVTTVDGAENGSAVQKNGSDDAEEPKEQKQTSITDFMRKRKLSSNQKETMTPESKTRRRFST